MITLLFVRHGETDWNREGRFQGAQDIPLNDDGRAQARKLAEGWDEGGDLLLASPLSRAWETAGVLAQTLNLTPQSDPRLVERSYGQGEGLTQAERQTRFPDGQVPGLESTESLRARVQGFLDSMSRDHDGRRLVVVSHGGFINAALWVVSGGEVGTGKSFLANASVSRIEFSAHGWSVASVGRTHTP